MTSNEGKPPPGGEPQPLPKRFYSQVSVEPAGPAGAVVLLDGRTARTPLKRPLQVPTLSLARAISGEWAAQGDRVMPARMPLTRLANTAIDGVSGREAEVSADVIKYAGSDLVCYRADRPTGLVQRQKQAWDPVLEWAAQIAGEALRISTGINHVAQPDGVAARLAKRVEGRNAFELTALHTITTLTGSALLAIGVLEAAWSAEQAWSAAHIDEDWQIDQWGEDAEANARRAARWVEMSAAGRLIELLRSG